MINVVLDTNILVSGLLSSQGNPAKVVNAFRNRQFNLFYNDEIMAEYKDVLFRVRLGLNPDDINDLFSSISAFGFLLTPQTSKLSMPDEDDRIFYDTALSAKAYLITGNIRDYPDEPFIVTPAQFVDLALI